MVSNSTEHSESSWRQLLAMDLGRYDDVAGTGVVRMIWAFVTIAGVRASVLLRLQEHSPFGRVVAVKKLLRTVNLILTGADFVPGCRIGGGLVMRHPNGIVVGGTASVGENCTILQQVTLGENMSRSSSQRPGGPTVGDDVVLGAGAKILGSVKIGSGVTVGANAVVIRSVPSGSVVGGVPARILASSVGDM
ncbi:serine O-acetyltransferase [Smaragdicoccus niigatensis]|uniref:serine O-acetyltransferase n=1 Tax=Smaragdicoccus niigatensis TaxID=359359 RepID=UPI00037E8822|nr:serine acetyltransferase [Smaragdicoccus niigatensis]